MAQRQVKKEPLVLTFVFVVLLVSPWYQSYAEQGNMDISHQEKTYAVNYDIQGGEVLDITPNTQDVELIVDVNVPEEQGSLTITIPRNLLDSKIEGDDTDFFVISDGDFAVFEETETTLEHRTLSIELMPGTAQIEIFGTHIGDTSLDQIIEKDKSKEEEQPQQESAEQSQEQEVVEEETKDKKQEVKEEAQQEEEQPQQESAEQSQEQEVVEEETKDKKQEVKEEAQQEEEQPQQESAEEKKEEPSEQKSLLGGFDAFAFKFDTFNQQQAMDLIVSTIAGLSIAIVLALVLGGIAKAGTVKRREV